MILLMVAEKFNDKKRIEKGKQISPFEVIILIGLM
jgi:hypothetical protein